MTSPYPEDDFTDSDNEGLKNVKIANKQESGKAIVKTMQLVSYCDDPCEGSSSEKEEAKSTCSLEEEIKGPEHIEVSGVKIFPEPKGQCNPELQEKITKMMRKMKETDCDWNCFIQERKSFRNPSIYEKLIEFCGINEFGTNYEPEVYNPSKWGNKSYYNELFRVQKLEIEERKAKTKIEMATGVVKNPGLATVVGNKTFQSILPGKETDKPEIVIVKERRKKTKWDHPTALRAKSVVSVITKPATNPMQSNLLFGFQKSRESI